MKKRTLTLISLMLMLSLTSCSNVSKSTEISKSETTEKIEQTEHIEQTEQSETEEDDTYNGFIVDSKNWPDYKKTMKYYIELGMFDVRAAHNMNPDIYGVETADKATTDILNGEESGDSGLFIKSLMVPTEKGGKVEALWYTETNTVQYIYCGEIVESGMWYHDEASEEALDNYADAKYGDINYLNLTHQDKIAALGKPTMTDEQVIEAITGGKNKYIKRLIVNTTKGFKIQAYWNMNDNTVEYVYPGDEAPYGGRSYFVRSADELALQGKFEAPLSERKEILGEPEVTDEEVIATLKENIANGTYMGP